MATNKVTASGRWGVLDANRKAHLERARKCSELTLPSLLPPEGADENTPLPTPWQTMGARCVNNLASKIVLTLMPPNAPCMRFVIDQTVIDQLKAQMGDARYAQEVEFALSKQEWEVQKWMEKSRIRAPSFRIMRLLISTGNALMFRTPKGGLKVYRLDQYVVRRNGQGEPVEIVVKEPISPENVPDSCRLGETKEDTTGKHDMLSLYTYCRKRDDEWQVWQEINDKVVPKSKGKFTDEDSFPFRPLVWSLSDGEDYGRGHVEEHLGDFISLEELTKAVVESTAAGAKLLFMINPNGVTRKRDLIETPNGGFCMGVMDDVGILRVEKMNDLSVAANQIDKLEKNLSMAFLLHASIQRSGERVILIVALLKLL